MTSNHTDPDLNGADLLLPAGTPSASAVYAYRTHGSVQRASALPAALAARGIATLTVDLDRSQPQGDNTPAEDHDTTAITRAADRLLAAHRAPLFLIGHSAAGPLILAAAAVIAEVRAVVTVGSPAPRALRRSGLPLLVMHAPRDVVVPAGEANRVFAAGRHPKSFIALDGVDHAVSEPHQARRVAALIATWAEPYLSDSTVGPPSDPTGVVVVSETGTGRYSQTIAAGRHLLAADEPLSLGGADAGPTPYDLLLAALGACTAMTLRMYAERKRLPLHRTTVRLWHDRVHAKDCADTEQNTGKLSRIRREIDIDGPVSEQDRQRLVEIADRCPVHRTLSSEIVLETTEA
jgi:putative redox protein